MKILEKLFPKVDFKADCGVSGFIPAGMRTSTIKTEIGGKGYVCGECLIRRRKGHAVLKPGQKRDRRCYEDWAPTK